MYHHILEALPGFSLTIIANIFKSNGSSQGRGSQPVVPPPPPIPLPVAAQPRSSLAGNAPPKDVALSQKVQGRPPDRSGPVPVPKEKVLSSQAPRLPLVDTVPQSHHEQASNQQHSANNAIRSGFQAVNQRAIAPETRQPRTPLPETLSGSDKDTYGTVSFRCTILSALSHALGVDQEEGA
jgi:hypothetical protein